MISNFQAALKMALGIVTHLISNLILLMRLNLNLKMQPKGFSFLIAIAAEYNDQWTHKCSSYIQGSAKMIFVTTLGPEIGGHGFGQE